MRSSEQCGGRGWDIILLSSCTLLALPASRETPDASSHPTIQSFDVLGSSLVIDGNNFGGAPAIGLPAIAAMAAPPLTIVAGSSVTGS